MPEVMSRSSLLNELDRGAEILRGAGTPDPEREAARLWAALTGASLDDVWLERNAAVPGTLVKRFRTALGRLAGGEPLAYAAGGAAFRTIDVKVDRRVLIPRPETEGLVEHVLQWAARRAAGGGSWGRAADIGTGSGCIALSLAVEGRFEAIVATDVSRECLRVARENIAHVAPPVTVELLCGDLLEPLSGAALDVVISNPPYVAEGEFRGLDPSVRCFEPRHGLVSGTDGLAHTRRLLGEAGARLVPGGLLALEVDSQRARTALDLARAAGWREPRLEPDLFGRPRYLLAIRKEPA